jgi:hypothetical protein
MEVTPFLPEKKEVNAELVAKADAFYKAHEIHPFTVMDVEAFLPKWDHHKPVLTFYLITGGFKKVEVDTIDNELLPYLVVLTGSYPEGGYKSLPGFFDLHIKQRDARKEWQKTQAITLDHIDFHAARFLRIVRQLQAYEDGECQRKNSLRKYRKRWEPYIVKEPWQVNTIVSVDDVTKIETFHHSLSS